MFSVSFVEKKCFVYKEIILRIYESDTGNINKDILLEYNSQLWFIERKRLQFCPGFSPSRTKKFYIYV